MHCLRGRSTSPTCRRNFPTSSIRRAACCASSSAIPKGASVYAVEVSDHIMIAHSFKGEVFGPAQALHGATFTVAVAFMSETLDSNGIVVDIGCAIDVLKATLKVVNYKNLDDIAQFKGVNTTTEWLTRWVFDQFAEAVKAGKLGRAPKEISAIRITVGESPNARAWYEAPLW